MPYNKESFEELKKQNQLLKNELKRLKTELESRETKLSEKDLEWYKILNKYSREGIFIIDKGRLVMFNKMGCEMFGYDCDEAYGMDSLSVYDDASRKLIQSKVNQKYTGFYEATAIKKNGTKFPVEIFVHNIIYQGREVRLAIIRDITERIESRKKIEQNEIKFKTLFEYAGDGILLGDNKGYIVDMNSRFCELTGYRREELLNVFVGKIFSKKSLDKKPLKFDMLKKVPLMISEREIVSKNGNIIPIEMNTTLIKNNYHLAIFRDLTERKKTEKALIAKNKELQLAKEKAEESDKLKSVFLANMSHEIRTPMNGIMGFARMLGEENIDREEQKLYINIIENSSNQLMRIIDDILEISILETKQVKVVEHLVNINKLFLELFTLYDHQAKNNKTPLYMKTGLTDDKALVYIDDVKLRKVLCNLIDNALRYTNEGFIEFGYDLKGNDLVIQVKDTGIGIAKEKQKIIFDRFSQAEKKLSREYGGLGLGLSIAKENVELMGGEIYVESEPEKGSVFTFTVPYKTVAKSPAGKTNKRINKEQEKVDENFSVLIAEDDEVNFFYLSTIIRKINGNINIIHAKNGPEVIDICRNNNNIDLVLMDIKMPKVNGLDATRKIKEFAPDLKIIVQSAYSTLKDRHDALMAGCDDYLEKPVNIDLLKDIMNKVILEKTKSNG